MACNSRNVKLFFESTSLRGFSRMVRPGDRYLRYLWMVFVITTSTTLFISSYKIVMDYLQYSVNIQTTLKLDDASPFPAVTFCNHQPFSKNAYELWRQKKIMSPTQFNRQMRQAASSFLKKAEADPSLRDQYNMYFSLGVTWDHISLYYQHLSPDDSMQLGHNRSMIHNCMWVYQGGMAFGDQCEDEMWIVKNYSHHTFFNCLTIEAHPKNSIEVGQLGMIVWLGPPEDYDIQFRQAFLFDIYEQAYGLRVVVHSPNTFPDIEREGIQIEPGKMNEINYQATRFLMQNTYRNPCYESPQVTYRDLNNEYQYNFELCIKAALQQRILDKCKCIYGYYPRIISPNATYPYCGRLDMENSSVSSSFMGRARCVRGVLGEKSEIMKHLEKSTCLRSCVSNGFDSTVSVTKWRPTAWQLHWLPEVYGRFLKLQIAKDEYENNRTETYYKQEFDDMLDFLNKENLTQFKKGQSENLVFDDRYTFVVIKRKSNNTQVKEERLVLTISALFSRIGGLCSLFIGLTLAFFVEVLEFCYIVCHKQHKERLAAQQQQQIQQQQPLPNSQTPRSQTEPIPHRTNASLGPPEGSLNSPTAVTVPLMSSAFASPGPVDDVWMPFADGSEPTSLNMNTC